MAVRETARTVTVPRQAGPVEPPLAAPSSEAAPEASTSQVPADRAAGRPLSAEERQFTVAIIAMALVLNAIIGVGLVFSEHVWG